MRHNLLFSYSRPKVWMLAVILLTMAPLCGEAQSRPGFFQRLFGISDKATLENHRWYLRSLDGNPLPSGLDHEVYIDFSSQDGKIRGKSFCQDISGTYALQWNQGLRWDWDPPLYICPQDSSWENQLRRLLPYANQYEINEDFLILKNNNLVLSIWKRCPHAPSPYNL